MTKSKTSDEVLILAKQTQHLGRFITSFNSLEIATIQVESLTEAFKNIEDKKNKTVVHILEGYEREETGLFHHRTIRRFADFELHIFIVYRGENTRAIAFSCDCGMRKAAQAELTYDTLGSSVTLSLNAYKSIDPNAQKLLNLTRSGDCLVNSEDRELLRSLSKQYENLEQIKLAHSQELISAGDPKSAIPIIRQVLQTDPKNIRAMTVLAEAMIQCQQHSEAIKLIYSIETMAAGNPRRIGLLAQLLAHAGDRENAMKCLLRSVQIYPIPEIVRPALQKLSPTQEEKNLITNTIDFSICAPRTSEQIKKLLE